MCFCFGLPLDLYFHMSSTTYYRELSGILHRICIVDFVIWLSVCGSYIISPARWQWKLDKVTTRSGGSDFLPFGFPSNQKILDVHWCSCTIIILVLTLEIFYSYVASMYICILYLEILQDDVLFIDVFVFIITYLETCLVDVVIWMCYIVSFALMYLLMRLCICYSFMIMSIVLKTNLINKTFLNVTQCEGILEEWKLYL